jgi:hypothetical protein
MYTLGHSRAQSNTFLNKFRGGKYFPPLFYFESNEKIKTTLRTPNRNSKTQPVNVYEPWGTIPDDTSLGCDARRSRQACLGVMSPRASTRPAYRDRVNFKVGFPSQALPACASRNVAVCGKPPLTKNGIVLGLLPGYLLLHLAHVLHNVVKPFAGSYFSLNCLMQPFNAIADGCPSYPQLVGNFLCGHVPNEIAMHVQGFCFQRIDLFNHDCGLLGSRASRINTEKILQYRAERLEAGAGPGTVNRELTVFRAMFCHRF